MDARHNGTGITTTYNNFAPGSGRAPVVGDWNGDGRTKIGWNVNGFWCLDYNGDGIYTNETIDRFAGFGGNAGEIPLVGDWSGNTTGKIGVYYQGFWAEDLNGNFSWDGTPTDSFVAFGGNSGEVPVIGDWNGSGTTKIGLYYNAYFILDFNGDNSWEGPPTDRYFQWAQSYSAPVIGRWGSGHGTANSSFTPLVPEFIAETLPAISSGQICPNITGQWTENTTPVATWTLTQSDLHVVGTVSATAPGCPTVTWSVSGNLVNTSTGQFTLSSTNPQPATCNAVPVASASDSITLNPTACVSGQGVHTVQGSSTSQSWAYQSPVMSPQPTSLLISIGLLQTYSNSSIYGCRGQFIGVGYGYSHCIKYTVLDQSGKAIVNTTNYTSVEEVSPVYATYEASLNTANSTVNEDGVFGDFVSLTSNMPLRQDTKGVAKQEIYIKDSNTQALYLLKTLCVVKQASDVLFYDITNQQNGNCSGY